MSPRRLALAVLLIAAAAQAAPPEGVDDLLRSSRLWELKYRPDLARVALDKVLAAEHEEPRALLRLGLLELDSARGAEAAKVLLRLRAAHPEHPAVTQLADAIRIAGPERQKWSTARRLSETGEAQQAIATLQELFPNGAPHGDLGIAYWRIIGDDDAHWQQAREGLEGLLLENPGDPPFMLGLARHLLERPSTGDAGLRLLEILSQQDGANHALVMEIWRKALLNAGGAAPADSVRAYLLLVPEDTDIAGLPERREQAARARQQQLEQERVAARHRAQAAVLLRNHSLIGALYEADAAALPKLDPLLTQAIGRYPQHPALVECMGLLRLQQRRLGEAWDWFERGLALDPREPGRWRALLRTALYLQLREPDAQEAEPALNQQLRSAAESLLEGKLGPLADYAASLMQRSLVINAELRWRQVLTLDPLESTALEGLILRLAASGREAEADARLSALGKQQPKAAPQIAELQAQLLGLRAQAAQGRDDPYNAMLALDAARALNPRSPWTRYRLARQYLALGSAADARELMAEGVKRAPRDADTRYAQALLLSSLDDLAGALGTLGQIPARERSEGAQRLQQRLILRTQLQTLRFMAATGDAQGVERALEAASAEAGSDPELLSEVADARRALSQTPVAAAGVTAIPAAPALAAADPPPPPVIPPWLVAADARSDTRDDEPLRNTRVRVNASATAPPGDGAAETLALPESGAFAPKLSELWTALNYRDKPGDPGVSAFTHAELPIEARASFGDSLSGFVQISPTRADAGTLPADYDQAARYGQVQALGPASLAAFPAGVEQKASGVGLGIGVESADWHADIGSTPTGFPVHYLVGGLKYSSALGPLDYALNLSRRPVTSSLLSYAGARDPVSGTVWGGVRSTGASLRLAHYERLWSTSLTGGYFRLTGENVLDNSQVSVRATGSRTLLELPGMEFSAGLALTYWRYAENLRHYTFGHGGYYSPQRYTSLALPLEWTGALSSWSWLLRGGVSYSRSQEKSTDFYPNDAALQTAALSSPLPSGFSAPVYDGGPGLGFGYFLSGALEYQLLPQFALGGRTVLDRSDFYEPNFFTLYLRYAPDSKTAASFPPEPPQSYSDY